MTSRSEGSADAPAVVPVQPDYVGCADAQAMELEAPVVTPQPGTDSNEDEVMEEFDPQPGAEPSAAADDELSNEDEESEEEEDRELLEEPLTTPPAPPHLATPLRLQPAVSVRSLAEEPAAVKEEAGPPK